MKDNFDLKKFLTENKTIENSNPYLKEGTLNEGNVRDKVREMIINELTNVEPDPEDLGGYNPEYTDDIPLPKLYLPS